MDDALGDQIATHDAAEDVAAAAEIAHKKGALLIVSIAEAVSLGIVKPPAEADIVAMEAQSFGVPLGFGGPYAGVIATKEKFVRQMPGRLVGETTDKHGDRGFVLTLATREQHITRRSGRPRDCQICHRQGDGSRHRYNPLHTVAQSTTATCEDWNSSRRGCKVMYVRGEAPGKEHAV